MSYEVVKHTAYGPEVMIRTDDADHAARYARAESRRSGVHCSVRAV